MKKHRFKIAVLLLMTGLVSPYFLLAPRAAKVSLTDSTAYQAFVDTGTMFGELYKASSATSYVQYHARAAITADHMYVGDITRETLGQSVVFGKPLYFKWSEKTYFIASANTATAVPVVGIALESAESSTQCFVLRRGWIRDDSWTFSGTMVYAGTGAGVFQSVEPATAGQKIQTVGQATSADIMWFDPDLSMTTAS